MKIEVKFSKISKVNGILYKFTSATSPIYVKAISSKTCAGEATIGVCARLAAASISSLTLINICKKIFEVSETNTEL